MEFIIEPLLRIFYYLIVGCVPGMLLLVTLISFLKKEVSEISTKIQLLLYILCGFIITEMIPGHGLYLG